MKNKTNKIWHFKTNTSKNYYVCMYTLLLLNFYNLLFSSLHSDVNTSTCCFNLFIICNICKHICSTYLRINNSWFVMDGKFNSGLVCTIIILSKNEYSTQCSLLFLMLVENVLTIHWWIKLDHKNFIDL